ncbi:nitrilase-related carbon-nitrogen hydrolase [Lonsdalea britannica]|uniref:nitrilase-related carbon-nitrogen hydrolase n=1 Tax=Lonsdalea britannica TaxID=1082704 RepID=UPI0020CAEE8F|nr:nitrilase-related carbon-nitrogen hydrolase [Lonsdalea britannica]
MGRYVNVAIGQLGPVNKVDSRAAVVARLMNLMREAHQLGADLIVYPELALTTFFPRWYIEDEAQLDAWCETAMPGSETLPLFELARTLQVGFCLGYAELSREQGEKKRFNTSILVDKSGEIVGKYHKVHLPGHREHEPGARSSIWKSAISRPAVNFRCLTPLTVGSAWRSATIVAGAKPIA